jgi:hypothetical protein
MEFKEMSDLCYAEMAENSKAHGTALRDAIAKRLANEGVPVDVERTLFLRNNDPNGIAILEIGGVKMRFGWSYDENLNLSAWSECMIPSLMSLDEFNDYSQLNRLLKCDVDYLRFVTRGGVPYYVEKELAGTLAHKQRKISRHRERTRNIILELPFEFQGLCDQYRIEPDEVLKGFIADLCNIEEDPYHTNDINGLNIALEYFNNTYTMQEYEETDDIDD